ncbi:Tm-1-like ATP-binding domain-containing protein [Actinomadura sp. NBRC 104412]|uniref:Tm-1-like ATP-binding domain-containing protein n=1 Tax=Actinomadura sp. NBRC 104412 TaxID=3032203 RepID=UPI002554875E|nr:Tm-1-like ATP-binding domain-containing protein [Actinomadura sp. NBRC 104412]
MPVVVLIGMLDVQGLEYAWLRDRLVSLGTEVVLVDTGILDVPRVPPDIPREEVAGAFGAPLARGTGRDAAIGAMAGGAAEVASRLLRSGRLDGVLAVGGHGNSAIATAAMRALPDGVPKLFVHDPGDAPPDATGLVLMDGMDPFPTAAAAMARMVTGHPAEGGDGPIIGVTAADVTSEGAQASRELLGILGYEVLLFQGAGRAYEALTAGGMLTAALDATPADLAAELLAGDPYPGRLAGAVRGGVPQVVSLGGLDLARFGGAVPARLDGRRLRVHSPRPATLVRTTPAEAAELGRRVAARLRDAVAPTAVYVPLRGLSSLSAPGGPFHDPAADTALFDAVRDGLSGTRVEIHELDTGINDPVFGRAMADHLHATLSGFPVRAAS